MNPHGLFAHSLSWGQLQTTPAAYHWCWSNPTSSPPRVTQSPNTTLHSWKNKLWEAWFIGCRIWVIREKSFGSSLCPVTNLLSEYEQITSPPSLFLLLCSEHLLPKHEHLSSCACRGLPKNRPFTGPLCRTLGKFYNIPTYRQMNQDREKII